MVADKPLILTLLIFVHEGEEETFQAYEEKVLPLLSHYHGKLLYRLRPKPPNFVQPVAEYPYEIHIVSFETKEDFEHYKLDQERRTHAPLLQKSVRKVILIEGQAV